jgi:vacuolar-type H+-ATPase subunit H
MEDLIMKIIDIEDKAQEVIKDAKKADAELDTRIQNETRKLSTDITRKMEAKNALLKQMEEDDAEKKIETINADTEKHLSELEEKYNSNKDKWVSEIVDNIIGR